MGSPVVPSALTWVRSGPSRSWGAVARRSQNVELPGDLVARIGRQGEGQLLRLAEALRLTAPDRDLFAMLARRAVGLTGGAVPLEPTPLTPLVGRTAELMSARSLLLAGVRLLTLTGPAGVGKTRLGLEVVAGLAGDFPDGVRVIGYDRPQPWEPAGRLGWRVAGWDPSVPSIDNPL
jgi:hypothetical protein